MFRRRRHSPLRDERIRAGFKSARSAAIHFSWSQSAYAAHESGTRRMTKEQEKKYFSAFQSLFPGRRVGTRRATIPQHTVHWGERKLVGRRLQIARRLAGFTTAKEAAQFYGWNPQNYYSHESARHGISFDLAKTYALAFGANPNWISHGKLPSGFAIKVGQPSDHVEKWVTELANSKDDLSSISFSNFATPIRRAEPTQVTQLLKAISTSRSVVPKAINAAGDVLDVVRETLPGLPSREDSSAKPSWGFPEGFLSHVWKINSCQLAVFAISQDARAAGMSAGDRVLVDLSDTEIRRGHSFVIRNNEFVLSIVDRATDSLRDPSNYVVLGRLVAKLLRVP